MFRFVDVYVPTTSCLKIFKICLMISSHVNYMNKHKCHTSTTSSTHSPKYVSTNVRIHSVHFHPQSNSAYSIPLPVSIFQPFKPIIRSDFLMFCRQTTLDKTESDLMINPGKIQLNSVQIMNIPKQHMVMYTCILEVLAF